MSDLTMNIFGFAAVNRDLKVEVRDPVSQQVLRTVMPFLDGTVRVPKIQPGYYEIAIKHPNLTLPVLRRPIRVLPVGDTNITVLIDPSKFKNTPIEDIPDANLSPVAELAQSVSETVLPLTNKTPGEAIRSTDWNTLASSVRDLALSESELTRLVSPIGHSHQELETKIEEMSSNFATLLESMSRALTELQRQIQALRVRKQVEDVLDLANIGHSTVRGKEFTDLIDNLGGNVTDSPTSFARNSRNTALQLATKLEGLLDERAGDDPEFANSDPVRDVANAIELLKSNRSTSYLGEINFNQKFDKKMGGSAFQVLRK